MDKVFNSVIDNINVVSTVTGAPSNADTLRPQYNIGDLCISNDGSIWVCTAGGRPGTWNEVGTVLPAPLAVPSGGTGLGTLLNHGVLVGAGTANVTQLAVGAANSVLQGAAGADPAFTTTPTVAALTVTTGGITVTGASTITGNVDLSGTLTGLTGLTLASGTLALGANTVSGAPTWSSNQAITLATASQPNVTSLGTLTALAVSGTAAFTNSSPFSVVNGQTLTTTVTAQTVGAAVLTIPNFAGVADTFAFATLAQTLSAKTLSGPTLSGTVAGTPTWGSNQAITLSTASQPNITSLGTLTGLALTGNVTFSGAVRSIWTTDAQNLQLGANGSAILTLTSGGGAQIGAPTGGDKGVGSLNAAALYVNGTAVGIPSGAIIAYGAGTTDPTGWFLCDGRQVSQTTFSALFAVIGTAYNTGGESAGNFRIPDFRSRVVMGADNMGTAAGAASRTSTDNVLGNTSGEDTHVLTVAELASHAHLQQQAPSGTTRNGSSPFTAWDSGASSGTNGMSTATAGSSTAHNNRQLNQIANWIIKQ